MTIDEVYARLKELAPNVSFTDSKEVDEDEVWDGDGPDPQDEGFTPYAVTWTATTIHQGNELEGNAYLGSCYMKDEEIGACHGYTPQKLEEAAQELKDQLPGNDPARDQLYKVLAFLKVEKRDRYNQQRAEIEAERAQT